MSGDAETCTVVVSSVVVNASDQRSGDGDEEGRGSNSFEVKAATHEIQLNSVFALLLFYFFKNKWESE